ncbi:Oidioi.mRNA.OKI2018_I69.chr1.g2877.t1.cds [Oikopleura dioica]|uniref:Oidioi.mRNA.OKI2018_I69.chr1.g2877.t1.cds n=1 Tax=Oikopleura dioica TaxID=34765 RepID=A0ABN7SVX8_OIKDI|nr:Oidioi.mRNA.OKI2018_I69.chr1.g2877.t1.cds [Oikopleura dioica]
MCDIPTEIPQSFGPKSCELTDLSAGVQKQHSYFKGVEKIVFKCKDGKPANVNILDCVDGKLYKGKKNRKNGIVFPANTLITCGAQAESKETGDVCDENDAFDSYFKRKDMTYIRTKGRERTENGLELKIDCLKTGASLKLVCTTSKKGAKKISILGPKGDKKKFKLC